MNHFEFVKYNDLFCRFKLKSGKEIFGYIWQKSRGDQRVHYFASAVERMKYKQSEGRNDTELSGEIGMEVNLEDIVRAEPMISS